MSKRAEEKAVEYQIKTHGPNVMGGASMLSEEEYVRFNMNLDFKNGYEQAEKDTIESVCKWLEEHFVDMSHYSDRGSFGRIETTDFDSMEEMVNDLKKALEEQK